MATRIKGSVGLRRIGSGTSSSIAASTRQTRAQMAAVLKNLQTLINNIVAITPDAVRHGMQPIFDKSQDYVPVDSGALKDSGFLDVELRGKDVVAEIGYAPGGRPQYAPFVHENLEAFHEPPTRSKFLEAAIEEELHEVVPRVTNYIKRSTGM